MTIDARSTPLPVPERTPLVILFGGTFDPPHVGHVELPVAAREQLESEHACPGRAWLVYVPAARSPHKAHSPVASDADRAEMVLLAIHQTPRSAVWTDEIDRAAAWQGAHAGAGGSDGSVEGGSGGGGVSYTIDTVTRARAWLDARGDTSARLRLLIGADQAAAFHRWREASGLIALAEPAVMLREPYATPGSLRAALAGSGAWTDAEIDEWVARIVVAVPYTVSSTTVRRGSPEGNHQRPTLSDAVRDYARRHHLYDL